LLSGGNFLMRLKRLCVIIGCLFVATVHTVAADDIILQAPIAVLPEPIHEFEQVVEGTVITHDFFLQNRGTAPLIIKKFDTG